MCGVISDPYVDATTSYHVNREKYLSGCKAEHHRIKSPSPPEPTYYSQSHLTGASYVDTTTYNSHIDQEMYSSSYNSTHSNYYQRMKALSPQSPQSMHYNRPHAVNHTNQRTASCWEQSKKFCQDKVNSSSNWSSIDSAGDEMLQLGCWKVEKKESREVKMTRRELGEAKKISLEPQLTSFEKRCIKFEYTSKRLELVGLMAKGSKRTAAGASSRDGSSTGEENTTPENTQECLGSQNRPGEAPTQASTHQQRDQEHIETPAETAISSGNKSLYTSNNYKQICKKTQHQEHIGTPAGTVNESYNPYSSSNSEIHQPSEPEYNVSASNEVHKFSSEPEHLESEYNASAHTSVGNESSMLDLDNATISNEFYKPFELGPFEPEPFESEPFTSESLEPAPFEPESFEPEPFKPEPFKPEPFEPEPFKPEPFKPESFEPEFFEPGPFEPEPLEPGPFKLEPLEPESFELEQFEPERNPSATSSGHNESDNIVPAISADNEPSKPLRKVRLRGARRRKQERRLQEAAEREMLAGR